ncbi:zinc-ribbon domain-containing protein [Meridianimarinicoccus aquatilis]|uniref:Zinc finger/thioredoxin putative domain-containing protein n=1 Tax=Meridianimarinicoccus aquatilis TaxID=2552766 RepID=A0A4R6AVV1_9RHOB|nr:zinc-ribbon domain-containing protein [Fluviibacterium aquatile]TDL87852.1 hypothetical protein E2L05_10290 [Fluviibacterium aquatile]
MDATLVPERTSRFKRRAALRRQRGLIGWRGNNRQGLAGMRIECPECGTAYEIPDRAVRDPGRDVQCSSCGTAWFLLRSPSAQSKAPTAKATVKPDRSAMAQPLPDPPQEQAPQAQASDDLPRRKIDPAVLDILREEADVEVRARQAKRTPPGDEAQTSSHPQDTGARGRLARLAAAERLNPSSDAPTPSGDDGLVEDPRASQRDPQPPFLDALPRPEWHPSKPGRDLPVVTHPAELALVAEKRRQRGFRLGFVGTAGLCCAALALYLLAADLNGQARFPFAADILAQGDRVQTFLVDFMRSVLPDTEA